MEERTEIQSKMVLSVASALIMDDRIKKMARKIGKVHLSKMWFAWPLRHPGALY